MGACTQCPWIDREVASGWSRKRCDALLDVLDEFRRVGLGKVDLLALDVLGELREHGKYGLRTVFRHDAIGCEHALAVVESLDVAVLVADVEVLRHLVRDLGGGMRVDVAQRLDEGVGELLCLFLVRVDQEASM